MSSNGSAISGNSSFLSELRASSGSIGTTYVIPANYSGWYLNREYDAEQKLTYFTEDIGWNLYYFYFRQDYPFWPRSTNAQFGFDEGKERGEEYLYGHKQILSRYHLERLSNDLGPVIDFDWNRQFFTGYYPTMTHHNALPFPQRPHMTTMPYYLNKHISVSFINNKFNIY